MSLKLQRWSECDVLIIGATEVGLNLAASALAKGLKTLVVSHRAYLSEDRCGDFLFWNSEGKFTETPMQIKTGWEQRLLELGGNYLLNSHTIGWLETEQGTICGAVCANRSGISALPAKIVIDASTEGLMSRLLGEACAFPQKGEWTFQHRALSQSGTNGVKSETPPHLETIQGQIGEKPYQLHPRQHLIQATLSQATVTEIFRLEAEIASNCWQPGDFQHQERLRPLSTARITPAAPSLDLSRLTVRAGLYTLAPWSEAATPWRDELLDPSNAASLAEDAGKQLQEIVAKTVMPTAFHPRLAHGDAPINGALVNKLADAELDPLATIGCDISTLPLLGEFDVVVVGGGTGGASAAIGASRAGASTLVIEQLDALGGVGTLGQIAVYWYGNRVGFTSEIDQGVENMEVQEQFKQGKGKWSVATKSAWYLKQSISTGAELWFRSQVAAVLMEGNVFKGLLVATPYGCGLIKAGCVVDSSGAAEIPAMVGAPTTNPGREHLAVQGTGLAGIQPGREYHNSDHNFSDDSSVSDAIALIHSARRKFNDHFDCGQLIDSRERRQVIGEVSLQPVDFLYQRTFPDTICRASSNFDSHGFTIHPLFMVKAPDKERLWVDVPFRCLLPKNGWERILVTGLGVSAHRDALPVIRMQADVQNQGYAAGRAAAMAALRDINLRELPIKELQSHLVEIGNLPEKVLTDRDNFPVSNSALHEAVNNIEEYSGLALVFAEPNRIMPLLLEKLSAQTTTADQKVYLARIIGLLGNPIAQPYLIAFLKTQQWDEGWDYRGMHQFGFSLSPVDTALIALGTCGDQQAWETVRDKIASLEDPVYFSHIRALCMTCERLYARYPNSEAGKWLSRLIQLPGIHGHAKTSLRQVWESTNNDPNDNTARNNALREIYLARALFHCGDPENAGFNILQSYCKDLRGHFVRHARFILSRSLKPSQFEG